MTDTIVNPGFNTETEDFVGVPRTCYVGDRKDRRKAFRKFIRENKEYRAFSGKTRAERHRMTRIAWSNLAHINTARSPG